MPVGVLGKLPSKRDFVRHEMPSRLTSLLDPWLHDAMAALRTELGSDWTARFLNAPIWRFWLGARLAGGSCLGAVMPSVDGVGRYYPLVLAGTWDEMVPPPEFETNDAWFEGAEAALLGALADDGSFESLTGNAAALPPPQFGLPIPDTGEGLPAMFATLRHAQMRDVYGTLSFWWAMPSETVGPIPRAMVRQGMPRPSEYVTMIDGAASKTAHGHLGEGR